jgi:hypothetical protein
MSEQKSANKAKEPKRDRWGLEPPAPGIVRGRAENLRRREDVSQFGAVQIVEFDLWVDDGVPTIPVRMTATDFQGRIMADSVYDIADPDPAVRPLTPWRAGFAHNPEDDGVLAHYPGRGFGVKEKGLLWTVMIVLAPFAAVALLGGVLGYFLHWFG